MKSVFEQAIYPEKVSHTGLKLPKMPFLRIHIPCLALILDAPLVQIVWKEKVETTDIGFIHRMILQSLHLSICF